MIKVKEVIIEWAEGSIEKTKQYPKSFPSIAAAEVELRSNAQDAPATGGYDKHGIKIVWEDNNTYTGRWDVKALSCPDNDTEISKHIRQFCNYQANNQDNTLIDRKEWQEFLEKYEV